MMKILFAHGKESGPWGSKIIRLANLAEQHGFSTDSIDYSDLTDPDLRVERLLNTLKNETQDVILVGSSMGGYVSLVAAEQAPVQGVFLLAPALYMSGYAKQTYSAHANIEIVHGWADDIIPPEHSIRYAKQHHCSLHLIAGDHRLNSSLEVVASLFESFLQNYKAVA
jgi:predicted esterase